MDDLLEETCQCKSVQACIDLAPTDAYGEDEQAVAWLTCIEEMFSGFKQVKVMGRHVWLLGFDLNNHAVVAVCQQGKHKARVTLDSVEFPALTPVERPSASRTCGARKRNNLREGIYAARYRHGQPEPEHPVRPQGRRGAQVLGENFPAVARNAERMLASLKMLEINVSDYLWAPAEAGTHKKSREGKTA